MLVLVILTNTVPYDVITELTNTNTAFIVATTNSIANELLISGIKANITVPDNLGFLKSLSYIDTKLIRYEYEKSEAFSHTLVLGPLFDGKLFNENQKEECNNSTVLLHYKNNIPQPLHGFFCMTSAFRVIAQAYKYQMNLNEDDSSNLAQQAKFIAFLSQSRCSIKKARP